jgi:hypothetical protein
MAGSFGYEAEHYEVSQQIGELVLFPAVRKAEVDTLIAAPGTSCRHQIADGTGQVDFEQSMQWNMGQLLSIPLVTLGVFLVIRALKIGSPKID